MYIFAQVLYSMDNFSNFDLVETVYKQGHIRTRVYPIMTKNKHDCFH